MHMFSNEFIDDKTAKVGQTIGINININMGNSYLGKVGNLLLQRKLIIDPILHFLI